MLKDTEDSKRLNQKLALETQALIVSDQYWPPLADEEVDSESLYASLHPRVLTLLDTYKNQYAELKKPRKLLCFPLLGSVTLDLVFDNGVERSFDVNPFVASLLFHVQDAAPAPTSLESLSDKLDIEDKVIKRYMEYWIHRRVVLLVSASDGSLAYAIQEEQVDGDQDDDAMEDSVRGVFFSFTSRLMCS